MSAVGLAKAEPAPPVSRRLAADGLLLLLTALWGFTFVAVKEAVKTVPVFTFLALRFSLAAFTLGMMWFASGFRFSKERMPSASAAGPSLPAPRLQAAAPPGLATGVLLFLGYALQTAGLQLTTASRAGFITGLSVAIVPIFEALVVRRRPAPSALAGVGLVAGGLALMYLDPTDVSLRRGDVLVLACAIAFAGHVTAMAHVGRRHDPVAFTFWQVVAVAALSTPAALWEGWRGEGAGWGLAGTLFLTGVLISGVMLALQVWGQRHTTATHAAVIFSLEPAFAALAGVWLAGDVLGPRTLAGGSVIVVGTLVAELGRLWLVPATPAARAGGGSGRR